MRWEKTSIEPFIGNTRVKAFFAWLPVVIVSEDRKQVRWLERVKVVQMYCRIEGTTGCKWVNTGFHDHTFN